MEAIHRRVLKADAHADIFLPSTPRRYYAPDQGSYATVERLRQGGVEAVTFCAAAAFGPDTPQA